MSWDVSAYNTTLQRQVQNLAYRTLPLKNLLCIFMDLGTNTQERDCFAGFFSFYVANKTRRNI